MNQQVQKNIDIAAKILREAGASEVYVFGSSVHGETRPDSDIDLAVKGLPPEKFFKAMSKVMFSISQEFDLVDLDEENDFTEYLQEKGQLVLVA